MRLKAALAGGGALLAAPLALAHRPAPSQPSALSEAPGHVRGAVHVHTGASSDGHGGIDDVARAAARAGLAFVVVTDHASRLAAVDDRYRHGVLVLTGVEKSTKAGHALVLGARALPFGLDGDPATVARDASDLGGFVVAAHPRSRDPEGRWQAGFAGVSALEVLNLAEPGAWPSGTRLLAPLLRYPVDGAGALLGALSVSREPLALWDAQLRERPLAGLLGSDAHGGLPSHRAVFQLASQHLLLERALGGGAEPDRASVLDALRRGRGWAALDGLANASRFAFHARCGPHSAEVGDDLPLAGAAQLTAEVAAPAGAELVLLRDGQAVARGREIRHVTRAAGTYRVEGYLPPRDVPGPAKPWLLSNPIYLYDARTLAERAARARELPPLDAPLPARVELLDEFAQAAASERWQLDLARDALARVAPEQGALRFDLRLGAGPATHASLCDWGPRDLSAFSGLAFAVRADRTLRFDVQVRVATEGAPGGVRIWRRSVRAGPEWRRVAVPFAALGTYDGRGGRPELSRVRGVYFHVDEAHLAPGSAATLWLDDYGLGR